MKTSDVAWLAGLLEGEGCFQIRKSGGYKGSICIALQMTDKDVVKRVANLLDVKLYGPHGPYGVSKLPTWQTFIFSKKAASLMRSILPLMGKRRTKKIIELLSYQKDIRIIDPNRNPKCHPRRKYHAKNLCNVCYMKEYHANLAA